MPQSSSEQSLVTNFHPVLMGNSDILVKDEFGQTNPLEVADCTSARNGELVNLENACVNIDNSSDVIIGPVTQFNVNGNVTIYQNENGLQRAIDEEGAEEDSTAPKYDAHPQRRDNFQTEEVDAVHAKRRKATIKILLWLALALFLLVGVFLILSYFLPKSQTSNDETHSLVSPPTLNPPIKLHQYLKRSDWGARPPKWLVNSTEPVHMVIIDDLRSRSCDAFPSCATVVATQQSLDVRDGHPDIFCNFLIGGDGNIYEGRGWGVQPQFKNNTVDIAYIGNYDFDELTPAMIDAAEILLKDGLTKKYLAEDYIIVCSNQTRPNTLGPGRSIFKEVKTWPMYDPGIYIEKQSEKKATEKH